MGGRRLFGGASSERNSFRIFSEHFRPLLRLLCRSDTTGDLFTNAATLNTHLAASDLCPLRHGPPDKHEHLADGAALEEAKRGEVRAEAEEARV
jgi:hypothetical protein